MFYKFYLDQDDVIDALREVKMPSKIKKKGRPRGAEIKVIGLLPTKRQRAVISKPNSFSMFEHTSQLFLVCLLST